MAGKYIRNAMILAGVLFVCFCYLHWPILVLQMIRIQRFGLRRETVQFQHLLIILQYVISSIYRCDAFIFYCKCL